MKKISVALLISAFSITAFSADPFPEPFGLQWGMSEAQLKKSGFANVGPSGRFNVMTSVSTPKAWSKGDSYMAVTYKKKLVKVVAHSKSFKSDIYGSEGKSLYNQVKSLLVKKYGEPDTHYEHIGMKLYDESDEFYQCLKYSGCGSYISLFKNDGGFISVELEGTGRGQGYLSVGYESPEFYAAKNTIEQDNSTSDSDAF